MSGLNSCRTQIYMSKRQQEVVKYWAADRDMSVSEFCVEAIERQIGALSGDTRPETNSLLVERMNELTERVSSMEARFVNTQSLVMRLVGTMQRLLRGDNYFSQEAEEMEGGDGRE